MRINVPLFAIIFLCGTVTQASYNERWTTLQPGLELAAFDFADSTNVRVLRIDLQYFDLSLFNASAEDKELLTARQWTQRKGLMATINASMYQRDFLTSVSLMRTGSHTNNNYLSKDKTLLAFDPAVTGIPQVKIIDTECDDLNTWRDKYRTLIQSIRMMSCKGENVWRSNGKRRSTAAIGLDQRGRVLFIHTGPNVDPHGLIENLKQTNLGVSQLMYTEGGVQAQLFISAGDTVKEYLGNTTLGGLESLAWPIPNVVGVRRKVR